MNIKEELLNKCKEQVENRLQSVLSTITSHQKALQSETKSSAGDKHETGRAMLQLEMEKASQQLLNIKQMKEILSRININKNTEKASLGSIIETSNGNYFLAVSVGKITVLKTDYFAISTSSPIGKQLLGKQEKEKFNFNETLIFIHSIK